MQLNAFKRKKAQTFPPIHDKGLKKSVLLLGDISNTGFIGHFVSHPSPEVISRKTEKDFRSGKSGTWSL